MANSAEVTRSENREQAKPVIETSSEKAKSTEHKMVMSMTTEGKFRVKLAGVENATAQVIPLKDYAWTMNQGTKLSQMEEPATELARKNIKNEHFREAYGDIARQIEETHASAEDIKMIAELFRDFGADDVFVYDGGIDMRKYGNRFDLNNFDLIFVIPETRKDELRRMLESGIDDPKGLRDQVRTVMPTFEFEMDNEQGLKVKVTIGGVEQNVMFLCGEVWGADREGQEAIVEGAANSDSLQESVELSEADLKLYDKFVEICNQHKDNAENCKNEILNYLVEEHKVRISIELRSVLEADEMFKNRIPTDIEYAQAKKQK